MPSAGRSVGAFDAAVPSVGSWFVQDVVRRVEHSAEQIKLIAQNLEGEPMGLVVVGDEVDHGDVANSGCNDGNARCAADSMADRS